MAGTISFDGLATGINATETVDKLIEVEGRPKTLKEAEKTRLENQRDAWRDANTKLLALREATRNLWHSKNWATLSITSSNDGVLTATSTSSAKAGTYTLSVEKLALNGQSASKQFDASTSAVGTGVFTVAVGDKTADVTITAGNNTLSGIADAINATDLGVTASVVKDGAKYRLLVSSDATGVENDAKLTSVSGDVLGNLALTTVQAAQDAVVKFGSDGAGSSALTVTSPTNKVDSLIQGVTLNLVSASPGEAITLTTKRDASVPQDAIQKFVDAYNDVQDFITQVTKYDTTTQTASVLQSDPSIRTIADRLRSALTMSVATGGDFKTLRAVGITLSDAGSLEFDSDKLATSMAQDYAAVEKLFRDDNGVAKHVDEYLRNVTMPLAGLADMRQSALDEQIRQAQERIDDMQKRLDARREALLLKFSGMESAVSSFNNQGNYLATQISGLNKNWG